MTLLKHRGHSNGKHTLIIKERCYIICPWSLFLCFLSWMTHTFQSNSSAVWKTPSQRGLYFQIILLAVYMYLNIPLKYPNTKIFSNKCQYSPNKLISLPEFHASINNTGILLISISTLISMPILITKPVNILAIFLLLWHYWFCVNAYHIMLGLWVS